MWDLIVYFLHIQKEKLVSLRKNVTALMTFLEDYSSKYRGVANPLENRIIDAAYQAEDIIETRLLSPFLSAFKSDDDFDEVLKEINFILEELMNFRAEPPSLPDFFDSASFLVAPGDMESTVGLDDDFMAIKEQMYQQLSTFQVVPIIGMGGIGKTTIARRLYEDSIKMQWYDRHIWIVVSQDYSPRKVLLGILQSLRMPIDEKCTDGELLQIVYQELFGRRYLIVADDVWNEEAWDILNRVLPKDTMGSQVLVTTRLQSIATYVGSSSSSHQEIKFLSEEQSWRLLVDRVFGKGSCPFQLEQIGMKIAKCCRGLPLTIVVVAGLLKDNTAEAYWRETLNMISSSARPDMVEHCSKMLSLSYDHLPLYLRPCFLYVTAFPEDFEVKVDLLVRLWMAEGFVRDTGSKSLEEVAEGYLNDLVGRSLLTGYKNKYSGEIEAVKIHDSLRVMGILRAQEGRFLYHDSSRNMDGKERRVTTDTFSSLDFSKFQDPTIRTCLSFLGQGIKFKNLRLLRVLYSLDHNVELDPKRMALLRHVSFASHQPPPISLYKLWNLQSLDIRYHMAGERRIELKIWKMPFLRHVQDDRYFYLDLKPSESDIVNETDLQTLSVARNLKITPQMVKMLANLRKLDLHYEDVGFWNHRSLKLYNLVHLQKLEELRIADHQGLEWESFWYPELNLPISLKKLELSFVNVPWGYINKVGLLPGLEVFKITYGLTGSEWNTTEGGFLKLKSLELEAVGLEHWRVESIHFPRLEILVLKGVRYHPLKLQEFPSGIGDIDGLKLIELHDCKPSLVASAKQIQADQQDMGNEQLQVHVHESEYFTWKQKNYQQYL